LITYSAVTRTMYDVKKLETDLNIAN